MVKTDMYDIVKIINVNLMIKELRKTNPYPEDIFPEPKKEDYEKVRKMFKDEGISLDWFSGAWGRKVWKNCVDELEKRYKEIYEETP